MNTQAKLTKGDKILISVFSLVLAVFTFLYSIAYIYNPTKTGISSIIVGGILQLPTLIISLPLYLFGMIGGGITEGTALGIGIILEFQSPIAAFILWFFVFYLLAKLTKKTFSTKGVFLTNIMATMFMCVFLISLVFYTRGLTDYHKHSFLFGSNSDGKIISISKAVKIGDLVNIAVAGFTHEGYTYITLTQPAEPSGYFERGTLWIGKVPENNIISFVLKDKVCLLKVDPCQEPLANLLSGDYTLNIYGPADNIDLSSDFKVLR